MTRLLVISDSHGKVDRIYDLVRKHIGEFDVLFHLGDKAYDMLPFLEDGYSVVLIKGNMETLASDVSLPVDWEHLAEYDGVKLLATHGHRYSVHSTLVFLKKHALHLGVSLVLFGHTHEQACFKEDGITYFNPGALQDGYYGIVHLDKSAITKTELLFLPDRW
ncbi:YfcE family phosphodiesterase [Thermospira aquatica]|uniref:Phosphoesterase n=1 Tax=Thermospira aquatica TaxID=2828656 RepID=A0AAX3BDK4_9SPIR|nr:YfcE family phosphodiesterase [Thermospira aquatica]URA10352.1 YfcE family phosphodiesterase [Thermospira aquatica]